MSPTQSEAGPEPGPRPAPGLVPELVAGIAADVAAGLVTDATPELAFGVTADAAPELNPEPGPDVSLSRGVDAARIDCLVDALASEGFAVASDFLPIALVTGLQAFAEERERAGDLSGAAIGRREDHVMATSVRKVEATWLNGGSAAETELLTLAEAIRSAINRRLFLGLFEFEAQLLVYSPGGFYARHLDSLRGARNRVVSFVAYLNRDWTPEDGGELDVWRSPEDAGTPAVTVEPRAGTVVLMLSEEIPHAVRPARAVRRVVAGWFRLNASGSGRVDPAR